MADTNITEEVKNAFNAMVSGKYDNFALLSCFVNAEPTSAVVVVNQDGDEYTITPVFVALTPGMKITDHDGREPGPVEP